MIASLRGRILDVFAASVLLEIQGIGYRVMVPAHALASVKTGDEAFFHIHDHLREDSHDLYGFLTFEDLRLFEQLLNVSGVGPKVATAISAIGSADAIRRAIMAGDLARMTSVPGVGKKTAQKIILELKGQLVEAQGESPEDRDAIEALQSLGYSAMQARDALKNVGAEITDTSARVREALRGLSK